MNPSSLQVFGVQELPSSMPQRLGPPPPQVSGALHVPHWMMFPQPSLIGPQLAFFDLHVTSPHPFPES